MRWRWLETVSTLKFFATEFLFVLSRAMRGKVTKHPSLEARFVKIGALDRHRAAINLYHEVALCTAKEPERENIIGEQREVIQRFAAGYSPEGQTDIDPCASAAAARQ
jgi:hypothetical protein